jgi:hypothetical protein
LDDNPDSNIYYITILSEEVAFIVTRNGQDFKDSPVSCISPSDFQVDILDLSIDINIESPIIEEAEGRA